MGPGNDTSVKVAVIMRTKDRPLLLRRAIHSVVSQTFGDFCVCIVNDGGDRGEVDQAVQEADRSLAGRIKIVHNEVPAGREAAINDGVRATESELITLLDDDDTWDPQFLSKTVGALEDPAVMGVSTRSAVVYETVIGTQIETGGAEILAAELDQITLAEILLRNTIPTNSFVYRRSVYDEIGGYDGSLPVLADWDFNIRFLLKYPVHFIDGQPLSFWHHRRESGGAMGNSVVTSRDHEIYRARIRDRYLRDALSESRSLGTVTYLADLIQQRAHDAARSGNDTHDLLHSAISELGHLRIMADGNGQQLDAISARMEYLNDLQARRVSARLEQLECKLNRIEGLVSLAIPKAKLSGFARRSFGKLRRR